MAVGQAVDSAILAHTFSITTADGTVNRHIRQSGRHDGQPPLETLWNVRRGTITTWDQDQRRFAVTNHAGTNQNVELDFPFATPPSWSLVPGPWMLRWVVSVQWATDSAGTPPCLATVIGCNDDRSATVRHHADAVEETEHLDNRVEFNSWTLLQTASRLMTEPDPSFRDWYQLRIGGLATFSATMRVGTRPHYGDASGKASSKTLAMVIPAKKPPGWQKGDHTRDPADPHPQVPLQRPTYIDQIPEQTGFTKGRSRTDTTQLVRRLISIRKQHGFVSYVLLADIVL